MNHLEHDKVEVFASQDSKDGMPYCGDSYFMEIYEDYFICVLADGLGSGQFAYEAATAVTKTVAKYHEEDVDTLMRYCNEALLSKRGATVAILKVNFQKQKFIYSCVGNIRFYVLTEDGELTYPLPVSGYLSGKPQLYKTQYFVYDKNSTFLLHSDGLKISNVKSILKNRSICQIAYELKKRLSNNNDDSTFIVGCLL
ncbi:negative regulator of sigma-B (phosphoserine phosphatase) [Oikeobacillus pervagus]|uniref:Negative regulator of sigma-B (Phosphoserine phosphatase) n=1 Tax=Oikeobacillus pervagus TaxID=1325931 RepID=A0AAJ1WKH1_9BACI|nr:PP2C family serine/threonine-protein phosphatase [Oikeobacillus pervagus]MDQ0216598.1 negative regulator of sigma-B (phosphoserine phosphatase) [Oikeobacillus pervagus]